MNAKGLMLALAAGVLAAAAFADASGLPPASSVKGDDRKWPAILKYAEEVKVRSSLDGTLQPSIWRPAPGKEGKTPLLVVLHSWSFGYQMHDPAWWGMVAAEERGWAFIYPHYRGPNRTPQACGSRYAMQDIADAVNWAVSTGKVDADRVYLIGGSGGGHAALLAASRNPHLFAAVYAACPPADVGRWHDECLDPYRKRCAGYARQIESACGGTPQEKPEEYVERSAVAQLAKQRGRLPPIEIITGIHDGHPRQNGGSVPVGHTIRAFNAIAEAKDRIGEDAIKIMEKEERVPEELQFSGAVKFFNSRVWLRRVSGNVRVTIFEAGHAGNYTAGVDWFSRQARGRPVDWSEGGESSKAAEVNNVTH
jgi:pimeloyl-ACP methyl ester carboxylesterase